MSSNKTDELKEKIFKAQENGDIAALYVMENEVREHFDETLTIAYFANILELALERLTDALEAPRKMDMTEVQDFATVRALYEYAIEHYSEGTKEDAAALFEVLGGLTNDERFSHAMQYHLNAAKEKINLNDFVEKIADLEATQQAGTFYISEFQKSAQDLL